MKKAVNLSAMSQSEINALTDEQFANIPAHEKRSCHDCAFLKSTTISLWCSNTEAVEYRGTHIPGIIECIFWKERSNYIKGIFKYIKKILVTLLEAIKT